MLSLVDLPSACRSAAGSAGIAGFHLAFLVTAGVCLAGAWAASRLPSERLAQDRQSAPS